MYGFEILPTEVFQLRTKNENYDLISQRLLLDIGQTEVVELDISAYEKQENISLQLKMMLSYRILINLPTIY